MLCVYISFILQNRQCLAHRLTADLILCGKRIFRWQFLPRCNLPEDLEQPEEAKSTSGELTQLTKLHAEGALTDEEFAAAKKKVLGL